MSEQISAGMAEGAAEALPKWADELRAELAELRVAVRRLEERVGSGRRKAGK